MDLALGLIETMGLVAAIEAADAMVKAADVKIISKEKVTGGLICIKVMGETAAVKSSVDAGAAAAQRVGELVSAHVIPRPDDEIDQLLFDEKLPEPEVKKAVQPAKSVEANVKNQEVVSQKKAEPEKKVEKAELKKQVQTEEIKSEPKKVVKTIKNIPKMEDLEILNVHALRRIARGFDDFPIKGREISKANRAKLLDYFKNLQ